MRNGIKALCVALGLMLALAPVCAATAQDQDAMRQVAQDAGRLIAIVGAQMMEDQDFFSGAPNQFVGWSTVCTYINRYAESGETTFSQDDVKGIYDGLFAEGDPMLLPIPDGLLLTKEDDGYSFEYAAGDPWEQVAINQVSAGEDGRIAVDFTTWVEYDVGGEAVRMNGVAELIEDDGAFFGAKICSMNPPAAQGSPGKETASATATLAPQSGISYAAKNVLDGKLDTCWAYDAAKTPDAELSIELSEPGVLRGLMFTPGYAKSDAAYRNNRRAKRIEVRLGDGAVFTKDIDDLIDAGFDCYVLVLFEGIHEVDSLTIRVLDTHPGEKFDDVCISEVSLF